MRPLTVLVLALLLAVGGLAGLWFALKHIGGPTEEPGLAAESGSVRGAPRPDAAGRADDVATPDDDVATRADAPGADLQPFQRDADPSAADVPAPDAQDVPSGRLVGRVLLGREPLPPEPVDRSADPALAEADPIWDESMLVGPDTGLQGVVVWPVQPVGAPTTGSEPVELTLRDGRFVPRHVVVAPGQVVRLVNGDPTTYRLRAQPQVELSLSGKPNSAFDVLLGPGESVERSFGEPEVAVPIVGVHPHDWVVGWVAVLDRPHGLTDAFGRYELELPAGEHDVKLWHETMDTREGHVGVRADDEVDWSVTFMAGRGRRGGR